MLAGWVIGAAALAYLMALFVVASYGDRKAARFGADTAGRPLIYALSLAIYCTSWTYLGAVGLAAERGLEFLGIYIGPILVFTAGMPVLRRLVHLAKSEKLTSIADFIAARYGKSPVVAGMVAIIATVGTIPYIALQLKAISGSVATLAQAAPLSDLAGSAFFFSDISLPVTIGLAIFAIIFGTRHIDATEHQSGLILAVATESIVKLIAITTVGVFVIFGVFGGFGGLADAARQNDAVMATLTHETPISRWIVLTLLSAFAICMLPRQFHVTMVENRTDGELRLAGFLFPVYLVAINLFVIPVAIAGLSTFGDSGNGDLFVLTVPMAHGAPVITLLAFIGGFSAATAMVIVASVAIAIMISNDVIMPLFLRPAVLHRGAVPSDFARTILFVRRSSIFIILLLGYAYYESAGSDAGLASIGLLSFAGIAQFAPSLFGGLVWRRANARGAIAGLAGGTAVWAALLFVPSFGGPDNSHLAARLLGTIFGGSDWFAGPGSDPLVNVVILSLAVNMLFFVAGSLSRKPSPLERIQAGVFIPHRAFANPLAGRWNTRVSAGELEDTVARYLGAERTRRSFQAFEETASAAPERDGAADMALVRFAEQLLASAIGSASARLVLSLLFQRSDDTSSDTARLLDDASQALQYNRELLENALAQMDQGITVFDGSHRLTVWNRRFRDLLDLPESVGRVGTPLDEIVALLIERGDVYPEDRQRFASRLLTMDTSFPLTIASTGKIIEIRSNAMPETGVVTTYADITQQVAADLALKQANETLEARVARRTEELTRVNRELSRARAAAEDANLGKTRFLAAVGHDLLQPLNAARLYSSTLSERLGTSSDRDLVRSIGSSLESVETILSAVLDLSRLDTGALKPQIATVDLDSILRRIAIDFTPIAQEKSLRFTVMPTSLRVTTDASLFHRLVQNLVSNAVKYTRDGRILIGARRIGETVEVQVIDTGIGIPESQFRTVFQEFTRLDEGARTATGLGLGLSIVDRIARVLDHSVRLDSRQGRGTDFRVRLPRADQTSGDRPQAGPAGAPLPASRLDGLAVLCIDNEEPIREAMELLLGGWGCRVTTADSLTDASRRADGPPADVIVADYHLGDGTGIDAITRLRTAWESQTPALLITADRSQDVRSEAEHHAVAVHTKPVRPAALRAYLGRVAALNRAAAE